MTLLTPVRAEAQAVIKGRVRAVQTGAPLGQAQVFLEDLPSLITTTNDSGLFRLKGIPLGVHPLRIRRIGFQGAVATLRVESPDSLILDLTLQAWVPELEPLFVEAIRYRSARMQEVEERRKIGLGRYILKRDLRDNEHRTLVELLREKGVEILYQPHGEALAIGSGSLSLSHSMTRCVMRVLLNGSELGAYGQDLSLYDVPLLGAVEIYKRPVDVPVQYAPTGTTCGAILLWTRDS
ncbi:MAG: carboxypeptidase-like regulatory domain-containing protein [Gemmatimonadota bacterium]